MKSYIIIILIRRVPMPQKGVRRRKKRRNGEVDRELQEYINSLTPAPRVPHTPDKTSSLSTPEIVTLEAHPSAPSPQVFPSAVFPQIYPNIDDLSPENCFDDITLRYSPTMGFSFEPISFDNNVSPEVLSSDSIAAIAPFDVGTDRDSILNINTQFETEFFNADFFFVEKHVLEKFKQDYIANMSENLKLKQEVSNLTRDLNLSNENFEKTSAQLSAIWLENILLKQQSVQLQSSYSVVSALQTQAHYHQNDLCEKINMLSKELQDKTQYIQFLENKLSEQNNANVTVNSNYHPDFFPRVINDVTVSKKHKRLPSRSNGTLNLPGSYDQMPGTDKVPKKNLGGLD